MGSGRPRRSVVVMPTAIVTGASRGLGLALADALAERGWRLVIDARDGVALERGRAPGCGSAPRSSRSPATSPTRGTGSALVDARAGRRVDLLVNNASHARPLPAPAARRATPSTSSSRSTA